MSPIPIPEASEERGAWRARRHGSGGRRRPVFTFHMLEEVIKLNVENQGKEGGEVCVCVIIACGYVLIMWAWPNFIVGARKLTWGIPINGSKKKLEK